MVKLRRDKGGKCETFRELKYSLNPFIYAIFRNQGVKVELSV